MKKAEEEQMMKKSGNKMADMPMTGLVLNISLPLMLSLLIQSLYNIVDSIFVSRLGEAALTATSVAYPVQLLMIAVGVGTGVGVNALLSRSLGAKDEIKIRQTAAIGVMLAVISSIVFMLLGIFFAGWFAEQSADDAVIASYAAQYLRVCMVISIGSLLATMFQRFLQASGDAFWSMISLIVGAVTNIILDPLLIFGIGPFPRMEVTGAAVATVIGQCMSAAAGIILNRRFNPGVTISFRDFRPEWSTVKQIYQVGLPTIVTQAVGSVMVAAINAILMPVSSTAVAFFGIYYKLQSFLFMPMNGLGQAAIPIIGYSYGAGRKDRIMSAIRTALPIGAGTALFGTALFMVFPRVFLSLFAASEEMMAIGVPALRIISVSFVLASVTMILGYAMSGLGSGMVNMIGTILRQLVPLIPLFALAVRFLPFKSTWYTIWISELCGCLYAVLASRNILKKKGIC